MKAPHKIDDCTLQLSHSGVYLDLELSISEQREEFETFFSSGKRNSVIIRTHLSVRVHACIEKLYNSKGRELRRALFSLKQIFQDDKDLVHEFVNADGLTCLIKVGAEADQNYQNYILRALGQIMLYVDGMNGVISHSRTVQWLYTLIGSQFRLVVKTTLKLLLVFVEYSETNAQVLFNNVQVVDQKQNHHLWHNVMHVLDEKDGIDSELLVYAMTLINKVLSNIPDQDTFYDITDALEELGMDKISQRHLSKKGNDLDLVEQFKIYEMALKHEDGNEESMESSPSANKITIKWNRDRTKSEAERRSRRISSHLQINVGNRDRANSSPSDIDLTPTSPTKTIQLNGHSKNTPVSNDSETTTTTHTRTRVRDVTASPKPWEIKPSSNTSSFTGNNMQYSNPAVVEVGRTRRRRHQRLEEKENRNREKEKETTSLDNLVANENMKNTALSNGVDLSNAPPPPPRSSSRNKTRASRFAELAAKNKAISEEISVDELSSIPETKVVEPEENTTSVKNAINIALNKPNVFITEEVPSEEVISSNQKLMMDMIYGNQEVALQKQGSESDSNNSEEMKVEQNGDGNKPTEIEALEKKMSEVTIDENANNVASNPLTAALKNKKKGLIAAAAEKLGDKLTVVAPVKQREKSPEAKIEKPKEPAKPKKDSDIMWEKLLLQELNSSLMIKDIDFSDLTEKDEPGFGKKPTPISNGVPMPPGAPPPPPIFGSPPPPPPPGSIPPPPPMGSPTPPLITPPPTKGKSKTVRLFWKEVGKNDLQKLQAKDSVWKDAKDVEINHERLLHLFQLHTKEPTIKRQNTEKRNVLQILDAKRSNAINIGLTVLPPPRTIKSAILNMDECALNREQIDKLIAMIPTEEEIQMIQDAMQNSPDVPLGTAEQFLLTLSSISELSARLHMWSFMLDYDAMEREIIEPLGDLRDGIKQLKDSKTFKNILVLLRSVGNFLNNTNAAGFDISYLSKVPEVKDTVHKHSLLHHLAFMMLDFFPDSTDLYSDVAAITRCSRVDFDEIETTINMLEKRCKEAWDNLKTIAKHESKTSQKKKVSEFLLNAAKHIIMMKVVHRRLMHRFKQMLEYFGVKKREAEKKCIHAFCRLVSEFALEYRTSKEHVLTQRNRKQKRGERNKTRGKLIIDTRKFSATEDQVKQMQMEKELSANVTTTKVQVDRRTRSRRSRPTGSTSSQSSVTSTRQLRDNNNNDQTDEIMDQLVKTATQNPHERAAVQRRRRSRTSKRKSLRRTLKTGISEEERAVIMGSY